MSSRSLREQGHVNRVSGEVRWPPANEAAPAATAIDADDGEVARINLMSDAEGDSSDAGSPHTPTTPSTALSMEEEEGDGGAGSRPQSAEEQQRDDDEGVYEAAALESPPPPPPDDAPSRSSSAAAREAWLPPAFDDAAEGSDGDRAELGEHAMRDDESQPQSQGEDGDEQQQRDEVSQAASEQRSEVSLRPSSAAAASAAAEESAEQIEDFDDDSAVSTSPPPRRRAFISPPEPSSAATPRLRAPSPMSPVFSPITPSPPTLSDYAQLSRQAASLEASLAGTRQRDSPYPSLAAQRSAAHASPNIASSAPAAAATSVPAPRSLFAAAGASPAPAASSQSRVRPRSSPSAAAAAGSPDDASSAAHAAAAASSEARPMKRQKIEPEEEREGVAAVVVKAPQNPELICTVCFEYPSAAIFQCINGHLLCHVCHQTVIEGSLYPKCPSCRAKLSRERPSRNRVAEGFLANHDVPCTLDGCNLFVRHYRLKQHVEAECDMRMTACDLQTLGCAWQGTIRAYSDHYPQCSVGKMTGFELKAFSIAAAKAHEAEKARLKEPSNSFTQLARMMTRRCRDIVVRDVTIERDQHTRELCSATFTACSFAWSVHLEPFDDDQPELQVSLRLASTPTNKITIEFFLIAGPSFDGELAPTLRRVEFRRNVQQSESFALPASAASIRRVVQSESLNLRVGFIDCSNGAPRPEFTSQGRSTARAGHIAEVELSDSEEEEELDDDAPLFPLPVPSAAAAAASSYQRIRINFDDGESVARRYTPASYEHGGGGGAAAMEGMLGYAEPPRVTFRPQSSFRPTMPAAAAAASSSQQQQRPSRQASFAVQQPVPPTAAFSRAASSGRASSNLPPRPVRSEVNVPQPAVPPIFYSRHSQSQQPPSRGSSQATFGRR